MEQGKGSIGKRKGLEQVIGKKKNWVRKKVGAALCLAMFVCITSGCAKNEASIAKPVGNTDSSSSVQTSDKEKAVPILAGVDYDEMFTGVNGERQKTGGKYATVTEDGAVRWDQKKEYEQTPQAMEMMKKVTVDGVSVSLPMKFEDITKLNPEYAIISSVNCKKIIKDGELAVMEDKKRGYFLAGMEVYESKGKKSKSILAELYKSDRGGIVKLDIDLIKEHIQGFSNEGYHQLHQSDIRVDGIGRGNTFNEMYQKFGKPYKVYDMESIGVWVSYSYEGYQNKEHKNSYIVTFKNDKTAKNPKTGKMEEIQNNMIQAVDVIVIEE